MSSHLPLRIVRPLHRQCLFYRLPIRQFSTTLTLHKAKKPPSHVSPSPQALHREAFNDTANLPDDLGLISGTFIRVPWNKLPPVKSAGEWWKYEWKNLREKFMNHYSLWNYKRLNGRKPYFKTQQLPLLHSELYELGKVKYEQVYGAFARGDKARLQSLCLSGVGQKFQERLDRRPSNLSMTWKVIKSRNWPATRVVSNRALELSLPGHPQTWIRQVVIRVKTRQRLVAKQSPTTKPEVQAQIQQPISKGKRKALAWTPDGGKPSTEVEEAAVENAVEAPLSTETEKDVTEYLVLQKRVLLGVEDKEWKIQGFASETTLESIASDEKYIREMIAFQTPA